MMLSIVMASFKRAALLRIGLQSISNQRIKYPFEIVVVNDGIEDETEAVCKEFSHLDIKYYFSGQRNTPTLQWRCPSFAINIGVKKAVGTYILLTSPEIYYLTPNCLNNMVESAQQYPRYLTIPQIGYDDFIGTTTQRIRAGDIIDPNLEPLESLNLHLPFCLLLERMEFLMIGGYDEEFIGYCYDDADLVRRLCQNGAGQYNVIEGEKIIHLFHGTRHHREGLTDRMFKLNYNQKLYNQKTNEIYRNAGKAWGVLDVES